MDSLGSTGRIGLRHVSQISCRSARWFCSCSCFCHMSGASAGKTWLTFSASGLFSSSRLDWACLIAKDSRASWGLDFELACCHSFKQILFCWSNQVTEPAQTREVDTTSWWKEMQSHLTKGMEVRGLGIAPASLHSVCGNQDENTCLQFCHPF